MPDEEFTPGPSGLSPDQTRRLAEALFKPPPPPDTRPVRDRLISALMETIPGLDPTTLNPPPPGLAPALASPVPGAPQVAAQNRTPLLGLSSLIQVAAPPPTPCITCKGWMQWAVSVRFGKRSASGEPRIWKEAVAS